MAGVEEMMEGEVLILPIKVLDAKRCGNCCSDSDFSSGMIELDEIVAVEKVPEQRTKVYLRSGEKVLTKLTYADWFELFKDRIEGWFFLEEDEEAEE